MLYSEYIWFTKYISFVFLAKLRAQAAEIEADIDLFRLTQGRELELNYAKLTSELEIEKVKRLANIETEEFKEHVNAIGSKTIQAIATSGPDNQVRFSKNFCVRFNTMFWLFRLNFFKLLVLNQRWLPMDVVRLIFSILRLI